MNRAQRRDAIIDRIAREYPNQERQCMAAYIERVLPQLVQILKGGEFESKGRVIAMRAYERTVR